MEDYKENLKTYIKEDIIYQEYLKNKNKNFSDFDKFCIQHCKDIEELLEENEKLKAEYGTKVQVERDLLKEENKQLKENWIKLKEYINFEIPEDVFIDNKWFVSILDKMEELEGSDSNEI